MPTLDMNCDMGESFGPWNMGDDLAILPHVSSVNIACGFHAGDPDVMLATVKAAVAHGVAIGAHPGLPDLQGFGRRAMAVSAQEVYAMVVYQVGALRGFTSAAGTTLRHVKPHGALYTMTAASRALADAVAQAVFDVDPTLMMYVANANMTEASRDKGLPLVHEVFADRSYQDDGTLTPRNQPHAMIEDVEQSIVQVKRMVHEGTVVALSGRTIRIGADTLCIHGDQPGAVVFAQRIRQAMHADGVTVRAP